MALSDLDLLLSPTRPLDPEDGQYTTRDLMHTVTSRYAYALQNPLAVVDPSGLTWRAAKCGVLAHAAIQIPQSAGGAVVNRTCRTICEQVEGRVWRSGRGAYCATGIAARPDVYIPERRCIAEIKPFSPNLVKRKFAAAGAQLAGYLLLLNKCCCLPADLCPSTALGFTGGPVLVPGCGWLVWFSSEPGLITYTYAKLPPRRRRVPDPVPIPVPVPEYEYQPSYRYEVPWYLRPAEALLPERATQAQVEQTGAALLIAGALLGIAAGGAGLAAGGAGAGKLGLGLGLAPAL
jgi:hypothetical protein